MKLREPIKTAVLDYGTEDSGPMAARVAIYATEKDQPDVIVIEDADGLVIHSLARVTGKAWDWAGKPDAARVVIHYPRAAEWMEVAAFAGGGLDSAGSRPFSPEELADRSLIVCSQDDVWITHKAPQGAIMILQCDSEVEAGLVCEASTYGTKDGRRLPDFIPAGQDRLKEADLGRFVELCQTILHRVRSRRQIEGLPGQVKGLEV